MSVETLGLNWEKTNLKNMINESNYIHASDNDGFHDLNNQLTEESNIIMMLKQSDTRNKDFTLEILL